MGPNGGMRTAGSGAVAGGPGWHPQRGGSPTPWAIATTSGNELDQDHIVAVLNGTVTGDWEDVQRLIRLLDGEPAYLLPLWEADAAAHAAVPPATADKPPVS
jgi:hypothetical protein